MVRARGIDVWRAIIRLSDLNTLDTLADGLVVGRKTLCLTLQAALLRTMERIGDTVDLSANPLAEAYLLTVELRQVDSPTSSFSGPDAPALPSPTTTSYGSPALFSGLS